MSITIYLETESFYDTGTGALQDRLDVIQSVIDNAKEIGDKIKKHDSIYDCRFYNNKVLSQWLYDKSDISNRTEKMMLTRIIDRTESVETEEYENVKKQVEEMNTSSFIALLCFTTTSNSELHINYLGDLLKVHRFYLKEYKDIHSFIREAGICFPQLYFHKKIEATVKSLSAPFSEYINEIIRHLSALNDDFVKLFNENKANLHQVFKSFETQSKLKCTLEGDKKSAKARFSFQFQDSSKNIVDVVCEPHTKLEGIGNKGNSKYRFDRIYFHQGRPEIQEGKVLVAHIGGHL